MAKAWDHLFESDDDSISESSSRSTFAEVQKLLREMRSRLDEHKLVKLFELARRAGRVIAVHFPNPPDGYENFADTPGNSDNFYIVRTTVEYPDEEWRPLGAPETEEDEGVPDWVSTEDPGTTNTIFFRLNMYNDDGEMRGDRSDWWALSELNYLRAAVRLEINRTVLQHINTFKRIEVQMRGPRPHSRSHRDLGRHRDDPDDYF